MNFIAARQLFFGTVKSEGWYRADIDGLRAIAVLAVIAYHYAPEYLPGGFIGVDIFFVISGYLITGILAKHFKARTFNLLDFYQRRIRRVFPALLLIFVFCLAMGWLVMFASEYEALAKHVAAGAGFVQNIVLWREAGYFDTGAIQKPLLHLWSLAVEEQFYIIWPLLLWYIMRRRWPVLASITVIAGFSFILNLLGVYQQHDTAVFYLPFTRAWELMAGAWLAIGHRQNLSWLSRLATAQSWLGLALILVGLILIRPEGFPGFWGLMPVLGSALIINAGPAASVNRQLLSWRPAVWVGLISYPLYLWHWTLLSFLVVMFGDSVEGSLLRKYKLVALSLSFILAWLTYLWVERPIRARRCGKITAVLTISMLALALMGFSIYASNGVLNRPFTFVSANANSYLSTIERSPRAEECFDLTTGPTLPDRWSCTLGSKEAEIWIAAYGDSHALSLMPALDQYGKTHNVRVMFAGLSGCPPLLETYSERPSGLACQVLTQNIANLTKTRNASAVILIGRWTYYTGGTTRPSEIQPIRIAGLSSNKFVDAQAHGLSALKHGLDATLAYYQSINIPVVLIEDNPQQSVVLPKGIARFYRRLTDHTFNSVAVTWAEHKKNQDMSNQILEATVRRYPVGTILNTDSALCGPDICPWVRDGKFLYSDDDHLSVYGAMQVYPLLEKKLNQVLNIKN